MGLGEEILSVFRVPSSRTLTEKPKQDGVKNDGSIK